MLEEGKDSKTATSKRKTLSSRKRFHTGQTGTQIMMGSNGWTICSTTLLGDDTSCLLFKPKSHIRTSKMELEGHRISSFVPLRWLKHLSLLFIAIYLFNWPTDSVCLGLAFLGFRGLSQNLGSDPNNCSNMCVLSSYVHEGRAGTEPFRSNLGSYKLLCSPPWFRGSVCPHFLIWVSRARKTHVFLTVDYPGFLVPERHREHPDK